MMLWMSKSQLNSLTNILTYMEDAEQLDWEESGKPKNHIFADVVRVQKALH